MNFFYQPDAQSGKAYLEEEEFTHCTKVLRNNVGDHIGIADGKGGLHEATISSIVGKKCHFEILKSEIKSAKKFRIHIAIAPTKSIDRTEWFVEKACEIGVDEISFLFTQNSERNKLRVDRLEKKAVSALKQSKSGYITQINEPIKFKQFISNIAFSDEKKLIGHLADDLVYVGDAAKPAENVLILIGPEGDFSPEEIDLCKAQGFQSISLGENTLRTETAALVAAQAINFINRY